MEVNEINALFDTYQRKGGGGSGGGRKTTIDASKFMAIVEAAKAKIKATGNRPVKISLQNVDKLLGLSLRNANSVIKNIRKDGTLEAILAEADVSLGVMGKNLSSGEHGLVFSLGYIAKA